MIENRGRSFRNRWFHFSTAIAMLYIVGSATNHAAAQEAETLIARVLATNSPWLNPKPATGSYSLLRMVSNDGPEKTGPFSFAGVATNGWQTFQPYRVGSMIRTPLHVMALNLAAYTLGPVGSTNINRQTLSTIDVTFSNNARCTVGMGGQADTSFSQSSYNISGARLYIDPVNAVPIFIDTITNATLTYKATWRFDPFYLRVDGGLAPRAFDWNEPGSFFEHQEFQVLQNTWFFRRADSWYGTNIFGTTGHIQSVEMTDLKLGASIPMAVTKSGGNLKIAVPADEAGGLAVEAADEIQGPWSAIDADTTDPSVVTISLPTNKVQFYRLTK